jgi:hypothetical protein
VIRGQANRGISLDQSLNLAVEKLGKSSVTPILRSPLLMNDPKGARVYYELRIEAASPSTEIWLGDNEGHLVQKETGRLVSSLLPGAYTVEFGLGSTTYPIKLTRASRYTEAQLKAGPSCPRPVPKL